MDPSSKRSAFTLLELLLVLGLTVILTGFLSFSYRDGTDAVHLKSGQATAAEAFQLARSIAILHHTQSRVLINGDTNTGNTSFLRQMIVIYKKDDVWQIADTEIRLPKNIHYSPPYPSNSFKNASAENTKILQSYAPQSGKQMVTAPGETDNFPPQWYVYEFNPNGSSKNPGAIFALVSTRQLGESLTDLAVHNPEQTRGFAIQRSGHLIFLNNYDELAAAQRSQFHIFLEDTKRKEK